jgi:hypothetical protein
MIFKKIEIKLNALFEYTLIMQIDNQSQTMNVLPPPPPSNITYPSSPNWSFAKEDAPMLSSAYNVIKKNEAWNILKNFDEESFMFAKGKDVNNLMNKINDDYDGGHSGGSMGYTMRIMQYIANYGFDTFVVDSQKNQG